MFFLAAVALAGVYMYFASKALRAEEDGEAQQAQTMTAVSPEGVEVEVEAPNSQALRPLRKAQKPSLPLAPLNRNQYEFSCVVALSRLINDVF